MASTFVPERQQLRAAGSRRGPGAHPAEEHRALAPGEDEPSGDLPGAPSLLIAAVKADPANRFFLSVVAAAAAGSIIVGLFRDSRTELVTSLVVFQGAIVALVFSRLNRLEQGAFHLPALALLWATMLAFIATVIFVVTSSFFGWPLHWKGWLESLAPRTAVVVRKPPSPPGTTGSPRSGAPAGGAPIETRKAAHTGATTALQPRHATAATRNSAVQAALTIQADWAPMVPFGSPFSERLTVAEAHDALTWSLSVDGGQGLTIDAQGVLKGTLNTPAARQITVRVSDARHAPGELQLTLTPVLKVCENRRADGTANGMIDALSRHIEDRAKGLKVVRAGECSAADSEQSLIIECRDCGPEQNYWVAQLRRGAVPFPQTFKVPSTSGADADRIAQDAIGQYRGNLLDDFVHAAQK